MEKRVQDYTQEILDTIRSNSSPAVMGSRLEDYHENDLADVLPLLTVPERCKLYRILDTDMLSDIFEYAESDNVAEYLEEMDVKKAASILSKMETDALEQMKGFYDQFEGELEGHALVPEDLKGGARGIGSYFRKLRDGRLAIPAERFLLSDAVIAALFWEC